MRIRATISNKNRKVYGIQPPNSERAVLQWCEAMRKPSSRVASASVSLVFAALASVALGLEGFGDFGVGGFDGFGIGGFGFEGLNGCGLGGLGF